MFKMRGYSGILIHILSLIIITKSQKLHKRCDYDLRLLWSREVGHTPFASAPLIADVNADGKLDIIASPFTDVLTVLSAEDGTILPNSKWPQQLIDVSVYSSPLLFDIDHDGMLDILTVTSDGDLYFHSHSGHAINITTKLPGLQVLHDWYKKVVNADQEIIHSFILDDAPFNGTAESGYVTVDPHVLATPVIMDVNDDDIVEELIIPVSYYFESDQYSDYMKRQKLGIEEEELDKYLASSIVIFNLTSMTTIKAFHLELTQKTSEYPGYVLFTPTVVDLDGESGSLEIIVGTSAGQLHVLSMDGTKYPGFPVPHDTIHGQVATADVNGDGYLEIIFMDISANVMCYHRNGKLLWEAHLSGTSTAGMRIGDVSGDQKLDIVMATNDGYLWIIHGHNGTVMHSWPTRVGKELYALPLVTRLFSEDSMDLLSLADDSHLHILNTDTRCRQAVSLSELSYVPILFHDMVYEAPGLEMLISTRDGNLMCIGRAPQRGRSGSEMREGVLNGLPSDTRSHNDFSIPDSKAGVVIDRSTGDLMDVTGGWMSLDFDIVDEYDTNLVKRQYRVNVYFGFHLVASEVYYSPGSYKAHLPAPNQPTQGHIKVIMTNRHGQVFTDTVPVRFNVLFLHDLRWLLLCPFVAMVIILLLLHGYPAADLLPMTNLSKTE